MSAMPDAPSATLLALTTGLPSKQLCKPTLSSQSGVGDWHLWAR